MVASTASASTEGPLSTTDGSVPLASTEPPDDVLPTGTPCRDALVEPPCACAEPAAGGGAPGCAVDDAPCGCTGAHPSAAASAGAAMHKSATRAPTPRIVGACVVARHPVAQRISPRLTAPPARAPPRSPCARSRCLRPDM